MIKKTLLVSIFTVVLGMQLMAAGQPKDRVIFGTNTLVEKGETVKDAIAFGGNVLVNGTVTGSAVAFGGHVHIGPEGIVKKDVVVFGGQIIKAEGGQIEGNTVDFGSKFEDFTPKLRHFWPVLAALVVVFAIIWWLSFLAFGFLISLLFPKQVTAVSDVISSSPWKSMGWGLLAYLMCVPLFVLLLISLIGIPMIPIASTAISVIHIFGITVSGRLVGSRITGLFKKARFSLIVETLIGLLALSVVRLIPGIGGLIWFLASLAGFGGVVYTLLKKYYPDSFTEKKVKKLPVKKKKATVKKGKRK